MQLQFNHGSLHLSATTVMGILNITPDSFSDGGSYNSVDLALAQAEKLYAAGAGIIDVGGESTRPGSQAVSEKEELNRVIPVIEALRQQLPQLLISVDTTKALVMRQAVAAGADMINDVCALQMPAALETALALDVPVCIMHMQGKPRSMQQQPQYQNVVTEVYQFLEQRIDACLAAGIKRANLIIDPGFGFGKSLSHNLQLLQNLQQFSQLGCPLLVGMSRKTMIGQINNTAVDDRLYGSIGAAVVAATYGADIVRVHDVAATKAAIDVVNAMRANKT